MNRISATVFIFLALFFAVPAAPAAEPGEPISSEELFGEKPKAEPSAAQLADAMKYAENIEIRKTSVGKNVLGQEGVFGELKNKGDRTVQRVKLTVFFLDKSGKPVFEKDYLALCADCEMQIPKEKPMKPGYAVKWGVKAEDAPSDWAGKVEVKVAEIRFAE